MQGVTVKIRSSSNNNVYSQKSRGDDKTQGRASPPLQKVGGDMSPVHPRIYAHGKLS